MTTPKTLSDWLNYMGNIHVSAIDMGLSRVLPVAQKLGVLAHQLPKKPYIFMVAGTNGKGSTTTAISQICQAAGLNTALYQSPHLVSFNERVSINGKMADDDALIQAFGEVETARLACGLSLSFFEMTTLAAFWVFAKADCDVWVLEVGLGGRLDVVNIIDPDMCVITNVSIDHVDWLGDDREKIGYEKAGILREGGTLIYGEEDMPVSVQTQIKKLNVSCHQLNKAYGYSSPNAQSQTTQNPIVQNPIAQSQANKDDWLYSACALTLQLPHTTIAMTNAAAAVSAVLASTLNINETAIRQGLQGVHLAGRFDGREIHARKWLFDVGHNEHGISFLMTQFLPYWHEYHKRYPNAKLYALFSMLADKDIDKVLALIASYGLPIASWHIGRIDNVRATEVSELAMKLAMHLPSAKVCAYTDIAQAAQGVIEVSDEGDLVLCFGSFHTIAESFIALGEVKDPRG